MHFKLYEGYVKETNNLQEKIAAILKDGKVDQEEMPAYSELKRRLGFEYNGMVLHEYYFGNLERDGGGQPPAKSSFAKAATSSFSACGVWKADFSGVGKCAALASAMFYQDPTNDRTIQSLDLVARNRQHRRL